MLDSSFSKEQRRYRFLSKNNSQRHPLAFVAKISPIDGKSRRKNPTRDAAHITITATGITDIAFLVYFFSTIKHSISLFTLKRSVIFPH